MWCWVQPLGRSYFCFLLDVLMPLSKHLFQVPSHCAEVKEACFSDSMCSPRGWKISRSVNKLGGGITEQVVGLRLYKHLIYRSVIDFDMEGIAVRPLTPVNIHHVWTAVGEEAGPNVQLALNTFDPIVSHTCSCYTLYKCQWNLNICIKASARIILWNY